MVTKFAKHSILDVWRGSECASECNSTTSYTNVATEAILKNGNFHSVEYRRY